MIGRALGVACCMAVITACGTSLTAGDAEPPGSPAPTTASTPTPAATPSPTATPSATATARQPVVQRRPSPTGPPRPPPGLDSWQVGASPLPLRPNGFGRVLPTPPELRVRVLPTEDLLLPPRDGAFAASLVPISAAIRKRMGASWSPECPVELADLRYVTVSFWGFDGRPHTGELVVNAEVAEDVVRVFERLYDARFPIEEMRLVTTADLEAPATGDGNNTAALVCRATRGESSWSAHAYGLAIDINPFLNPYQDGDVVLPELASAYLDRDWHRPGMVHAAGPVVDAFTDIGWTWGGTFRSVSDFMHFSATGR